ncbi:3,4-dihydroxy-2-butanone 4-phosphate synthase domain-containing protein [Hirsutella rhossiliensis]|uniref:3,4-dihydroxy-2-butanone 4-phosphate synthase n=1 Tax=Hirsutella rhossiliensis TaxID=111463 RepID=A0A9P8MV73_9HYPO|nr:3,4-dihydroxy-2-butanone 4-phosphate synthase domain-containing protein [Hirsutella rhossiliensis]KAH0961627.1 3,4-dihydroxy-2-butanone 4-phosphate synthase domain-containing protein [Hirsutella rhossiliensis]
MAAPAIPQGQFDSIPDAVEAFRNGEFLVVLDDPGRENEADLIVAAQNLSADQMAWMVRHSSGYICVPIKPSRADHLALPLMVLASQDPRGTAYTVSVDASHDSVTTGISAHDRALACRVLADPDATPASLRRPGHVLPLRAHPGGVRARPGHTEAAVELCRLAGLSEAAAICEIVDDGQEVPGRAVRSGAGMMRGEASIAFARKWGLKVCTIADLVDHVEKLQGKLNVNGST